MITGQWRGPIATRYSRCSTYGAWNGPRMQASSQHCSSYRPAPRSIGGGSSKSRFSRGDDNHHWAVAYACRARWESFLSPKPTFTSPCWRVASRRTVIGYCLIFSSLMGLFVWPTSRSSHGLTEAPAWLTNHMAMLRLDRRGIDTCSGADRIQGFRCCRGVISWHEFIVATPTQTTLTVASKQQK